MIVIKKFGGSALVTGGAKRIGQAVALHLADMGYKIALHYHTSKTSAQTVAKRIRSRGGICEIFACDLSDETQVAGLLPQVFDTFPDCCLLINCASIFQRSSLRTANLENFNRHFDINLKAPYFLSSYFARTLKRKQGHIINFLDTKITQVKISHFSYLLSKKALADFTHLAAMELAPQIRVNGIAPGLILAPVDRNDAYMDRMAQGIALKRKGQIKHILHALQFLLENDFVTGQIIFEDGGEHLN